MGGFASVGGGVGDGDPEGVGGNLVGGHVGDLEVVGGGGRGQGGLGLGSGLEVVGVVEDAGADEEGHRLWKEGGGRGWWRTGWLRVCECGWIGCLMASCLLFGGIGCVWVWFCGCVARAGKYLQALS